MTKRSWYIAFKRKNGKYNIYTYPRTKKRAILDTKHEGRKFVIKHKDEIKKLRKQGKMMK